MANVCLNTVEPISVKFYPTAEAGKGDITNIDFTISVSAGLAFNTISSPNGILTGSVLNVPTISDGTSEEITVLVDVIDVNAVDLKVTLQAVTTTAQFTTTDDIKEIDLEEYHTIYRGCGSTSITSNVTFKSEEFGPFTTGNTVTYVGNPIIGSDIIVLRNGQEDNDYTIVGKTLTFNTPFAIPSNGGGLGETITIKYITNI